MTVPRRPLTVESLRDPGGDGPADRLAGLPAAARALHRDILRAFLAAGQAPHRDHLRSSASGASTDLAEAWRQLGDADLVHLDADGRAVVAYPFSGHPTGHTVELPGGPTVHAMCAIDALGIPLMTDRDAVIVSTDPDDGQPIRIERRGGAWRWTPEDTAVLLAQSNACGPAADCLCPAITFHTSRRRAEDHLRDRPELTGVVLDQDQALEVAERSFGPLLRADPHTPSAQPPRPKENQL